MRYYTYVLFSPSRYQYVVGQSHESPGSALFEYRTGMKITTKKGLLWQVVFAQQFDNSVDSYLLMRKLQSMKSRKYLQYFIERLSCAESSN